MARDQLISLPRVASLKQILIDSYPWSVRNRPRAIYATRVGAMMIPKPADVNFSTRAGAMWGGTIVNATMPPRRFYDRGVSDNVSPTARYTTETPTVYSRGLTGLEGVHGLEGVGYERVAHHRGADNLGYTRLGDTAATPTCMKGAIWDPRAGHCVYVGTTPAPSTNTTAFPTTTTTLKLPVTTTTTTRSPTVQAALDAAKAANAARDLAYQQQVAYSKTLIDQQKQAYAAYAAAQAASGAATQAYLSGTGSAGQLAAAQKAMTDAGTALQQTQANVLASQGVSTQQIQSVFGPTISPTIGSGPTTSNTPGPAVSYQPQLDTQTKLAIAAATAAAKTMPRAGGDGGGGGGGLTPSAMLESSVAGIPVKTLLIAGGIGLGLYLLTKAPKGSKKVE